MLPGQELELERPGQRPPPGLEPEPEPELELEPQQGWSMFTGLRDRAAKEAGRLRNQAALARQS